MNKGCKVFAIWDPRPESPETLGQRMLANIDALSAISPHFRNWRFYDNSFSVARLVEEGKWEEGMEVPTFALDDVRDFISEVVERGVRRGDTREPEPRGGYTITAFNGEQGSRYVSLTGRGGGILEPRAGLRYAEFSTTDLETPDAAIVSYPVFRAALLSVASAWDVGQAQVYSDDLGPFWRQPHKWPLDLAWMTYLPADLAQNISPPSDVLVERTDNGGMLLVAAEEAFDVNNPQHMAAARSILASVADLNIEILEESKRLWPGPWWKNW